MPFATPMPRLLGTEACEVRVHATLGLLAVVWFFFWDVFGGQKICVIYFSDSYRCFCCCFFFGLCFLAKVISMIVFLRIYGHLNHLNHVDIVLQRQYWDNDWDIEGNQPPPVLEKTLD